MSKFLNGIYVADGIVVASAAALTSSLPLLDATQTWNSSSTAFTALRANITNTNSSGLSLLLDLQVGSSSKFKVDVTGAATATALTLIGSSGLNIYANDSGGGSSYPAQIYTNGGQVYFNSNLGAGKNISVNGYVFSAYGLSFSNGYGSGYMMSINWTPYMPTGSNSVGGVYNSTYSLSNADGTAYGLRLVGSYAQSGTASGIDIFVNRTSNTMGSGTQYLLQLQTLSSNKFTVSPNGNTSIYGSASVYGGIYSAGDVSCSSLTVNDSYSNINFNDSLSFYDSDYGQTVMEIGIDCGGVQMYQTTYLNGNGLLTGGGSISTGSGQIYLQGGDIFLADSARATTTSSGFLYLSGCAGVPTGTPTYANSGRVPVIYDTTDNKLYAYNSGWSQVSGSGGGPSNYAYSATFNATTDWGSATGGYYTITVTHGLATYNVSVQIWDETTGHLVALPENTSMPSNNTVSISVPSSPDTRFAGRIVVISGGAGGMAPAAVPNYALIGSSNAFTAANSFSNNSSSVPTLTIEQDNPSGFTFNFSAYAANDPNYDVGDLVKTIPVQVDGSSESPYNGTRLFIPIYDGDCFVAGTPVLTPDGYKPIETLEVGDKVISMDEQSRFTFVNEVLQPLVHPPKKGGFLIINEQMKVTPNHKIYVNDIWQPIRNAKIGDYLINKDGRKVWIFSIEHSAEQVTTYNIKVKEAAKNYFAHDLLVHNKCPFLYVFDKGRWIYQNTFLYEIDSPDKECVQRRKLRTLTNEFVIRELEPEITYIKSLALIAITRDGERRLAWLNEIEDLVTRQGDFVKVSFEAIPAGTIELWIEAEGHYIWLDE